MRAYRWRTVSCLCAERSMLDRHEHSACGRHEKKTKQKLERDEHMTNRERGQQRQSWHQSTGTEAGFNEEFLGAAKAQYWHRFSR